MNTRKNQVFDHENRNIEFIEIFEGINCDKSDRCEKKAVCHYIMSVRLIADFHWCIFTITHVGNWESEMLELFLRSLYVNQQEIGFTVSSQLELNHRE